MRNTLLIALILISSSIFSQNLVGKVSQLKTYENGSDYLIEYSDNKYYEIDVYKTIQLTEEEFHGLFDSIMIGFNEEPDSPIVIETEKDLIRLKFTKSMGVVNLQIYHSVGKNPDLIGVSKYLTKKAVIKLFGKK